MNPFMLQDQSLQKWLDLRTAQAHQINFTDSSCEQSIVLFYKILYMLCYLIHCPSIDFILIDYQKRHNKIYESLTQYTSPNYCIIMLINLFWFAFVIFMKTTNSSAASQELLFTYMHLWPKLKQHSIHVKYFEAFQSA